MNICNSRTFLNPQDGFEYIFICGKKAFFDHDTWHYLDSRNKLMLQETGKSAFAGLEACTFLCPSFGKNMQKIRKCSDFVKTVTEWHIWKTEQDKRIERELEEELQKQMERKLRKKPKRKRQKKTKRIMEEKPKRKRGRPRKIIEGQKKRGRPRKT